VNLLDSAFPIPGTRWRFGLDGIIGLIPGLGDAVTAGVSLLVLIVAHRERVPATIIGRMLLNILIDLAIGAVPFFGDVGDFFFQSNRKNLELLKRHAHGIEPPRGIDRAVVLGAAILLIVMAGLGIWLSWQAVRWLIDHPF
jgi:hypothetical protein